MRTFKNYINKIDDTYKIPHVESVILAQGKPGLKSVILALENINNGFYGFPVNYHISNKMDGSPSIVFGIHPDNRKFFICLKSFFSKNPKVMYTNEDIDKYYTNEDLNRKLKIALKYLPELKLVSGILQADVLFADENIKDYNVTPNIITYNMNYITTMFSAYPKLGISIHTQYDSFDVSTRKINLSQEYNTENVYVWNCVRNVLPDDLYMKRDDDIIVSMIDTLKEYYNRTDGILDKISSIKTYREAIERYLSKAYNNGENIVTVEGLLNNVKDEQLKSIISKDSTKLRVVFGVINRLSEVKIAFIHKLFNKNVTEGIVITNKDDNSRFKLVDRKTFTRLNNKVNNNEI